MAQADSGSISDSDLQKLKQWNGDVPHPRPRCIHDLIEQQKRRCPGAPAVHSWDGDLTYQRLDELSSHLAHHLVALGVTVEHFVPLYFEKSMWAVVSMLAVLRAGSAFTFIEPSHPTDRIRSILQDINAKVLLISPSVSPTFAREGEPLNHLVEVTETFIDGIGISARPSLPVVQPNNAAVALFTSGSTGKPKGIIQEHSTAAFSAQTCATTFGIGPGSRVLQWAAYCFDMSVIDMLMTLVGGGCICIPSEELRMNGLESAMREMKVDCAAMTPSTAKILKSAVLPHLRTLVFGGEAISKEHLEGWPQRIRIINGYGPGEASVCVAGEALIDCPCNIGRAVGSVVWIVDESSYHKLAPIGAVGELLIEGPLLARGYLNDSVKTAASFIEDPPWLVHFRARSDKSRRLYRTGDLARYHTDGTIEYVGRKDSQIKLRGQRIEPGDIEYHISQSLPAGAAVAVDLIAPADGMAASNLAVFVGLDGTGEVGSRWENLTSVDTCRKERLLSKVVGLEKRLSGLLPAYMIPPYVIPIKFLPLTLSGKLDRKLLRHIGSSLPIGELPSLTVAPESRQEDSQDGELGQMQTRIAELWLKVLPLHPHRVNPSDNFFKLGGDSIHAMQLVGVANLANIRLTTSKIFQHPTLTGMSLAALEATTMNSPPKRFPSDCVSKTKQLVAMMEEMHCPGLKMSEPEIEDIIEAPDLQAYMVVCGLLKSHGYINYFTFDLAGPIDSSRLADSCRMLVARHSIFRTVFALHAGRIHQVIRKKHDPEIAQCSSKEETGALLTDLCYLERSCDTQLGDDIVRFLLVERGLDKYTLIMRLSHAQFDGTSLALIYRDLQVLYAGEAMPPAPQFKEWAWASKEANSSKAEDYWRELLQGSTMTSILDHSSTAYRNVINSRLSLTIPFTSVQEKGITVATLVKAAWAVVLAELSSTTDVVFGNAVTGRNLQINAVNQIVGDCNNAVLVRARLENATTVLSLFKQIQDQLVAAIPYETIGCRQLVERCTDWPPWTRYSTSVNHQNYTDARLDMFTLGKTQCSVSYKDLESDRRDIQIYSYPPTDDGMMKLEMAFSDCALAKDMVERMLQRLGETVQRLSRNVDAPLVLLSNPIPSTLPLKIAVKGSTSMKEELRPDPRPCTFGFSLLNPRIIVEKVWRKFEHLFEGSDMARTGRLDDNTPFYELGGDLVYAVQLSAWYQQEGITFPMEELIENPTKMSQVDLLSRFASSRKGQAVCTSKE